jgi:hypothetical protein
MSFHENESYKHKAAKEVLRKWLKDKNEEKWVGDGVILEYPLIPAMKQEHFGNLVGYNYHTGDERYDYYDEVTSSNFNPSYKQCIQNNDIPIAVLDVAVVCKGCLLEGFEVYHTHQVDENKKKKITELTTGKCFDLYEISAETILRQTKAPENIYGLCDKII